MTITLPLSRRLSLACLLIRACGSQSCDAVFWPTFTVKVARSQGFSRKSMTPVTNKPCNVDWRKDQTCFQNTHPDGILVTAQRNFLILFIMQWAPLFQLFLIMPYIKSIQTPLVTQILWPLNQQYFYFCSAVEYVSL